MAITINLTNITVDLTTSIGTIVDGSTYTSPTRATCGVYVKVYKTDYAGNRTLVTTTPNLGDANTDTQWTFPYAVDGWYKIAYVAPPDYAAGTTYAKYDAVFDPTNKLVYRSKSAGNIGNALLNTTFWEVIPVPTDLAFNVGTTTESPNLTTITGVTVYNIILYSIISKAYGDATGSAMLEASSDYKRSEDVRYNELLFLAKESIKIANNRQAYSTGEIYARRAADLIALG